ncbi:MAG: DUF302 domain-containing protein [Armatimonadetes bacterium]|nr:DUF302 domain-containing protein [Armatimonadota bacterium]
MAKEPGPPYGIRARLSVPLQQAEEQAIAALKQEGFGILTRIDVRQTMKEKKGVDMPGYVILGACNPGLAYQALQEEQELGILLPCNVILYEKEGGVVVSAMNPTVALSMVRNANLAEVAREAQDRLQKAIESLDRQFG